MGKKKGRLVAGFTWKKRRKNKKETEKKIGICRKPKCKTHTSFHKINVNFSVDCEA